MGIILDTNILIYIENGTIDVNEFSSPDETYFLSSVSISELLVGVEMSKSLKQKISRGTFSEAIISHFPVLDFNTEVARVHAQLCAHHYKKKNRSKMNAHDLIIGATALTYQHKLFTNNPKDFSDIPGLVVKSYE